MSRHVFPGHTGATSVAIGWDRPLQTFFVQVFRPDPDDAGEETSFIWKGTEPGELRTPMMAISVAKPWSTLPDDLAQTLEVDRLKASGTPDGVAQIEAKRWISRDGHHRR